MHERRTADGLDRRRRLRFGGRSDSVDRRWPAIRRLLGIGAVLGALAAPVGCSDEPAPLGEAGPAGDGGAGDGAVRPDELFVRKSGTTALDPADKWFAVANHDSGSVTVYVLDKGLDLAGSAKFTVLLGGKSSEVSSLVAGHDGKYLLATLQYDQKLCKITIAGGATQKPKCVATGSEPTGVVVDETGGAIYVANMVDGSVTVYDSALKRSRTWNFSAASGETTTHPFALLYLKQKGKKGVVYISDYFAEKIPGKQEGADDSRQGVVYAVPADARDLKSKTKIALPPLAETGFRIPDDEGGCKADSTKRAAGCTHDPIRSGAFPNQLASLTFHQGKIFVTSTCASPRGDVRFNMNVHSCVHAIDATSKRELPALRLNIQERIKQQSGTKVFCTVPKDFACVAETAFCYVACAASDIVIRLDYKKFTSAKQVVAGIPGTNNLPTGKFPTGLSIVANDQKTLALTNNENSRDVTILDLRAQKPTGSVRAADLPTNTKEKQLLAGKDFFYTARGRWSKGGWSACVACHPRGLTDNVTWHFPTGPRQTVSMDGSFSKEGVTPDKLGNRHNFENVLKALQASHTFPQRIFNWTAVRDEVADFELNTRGVSGGKGAIVDKNDKAVDLTDFPAGSGKNNANNNGSSLALVRALKSQGGSDAWLAITEWAKTIRSPRAKSNLPGNATRGRTLFTTTYKCSSCHGGGSWTASRRYYQAALDGTVSKALKKVFYDRFTKSKSSAVLATANVLDGRSTCTTDAQCKNVSGACDKAKGKCRTLALGNELAFSLNRPIDQHACVLRDVGTYETKTKARGGLELRKNMVADAQGVEGFNVPSLLGIQLGAPYLHNGQYETLAAFLQTDTKHRTLINKVAAMNAAQFKDLAAFLLAIDGSTKPVPLAAADQLCPSRFP